MEKCCIPDQRPAHSANGIQDFSLRNVSEHKFLHWAEHKKMQIILFEVHLNPVRCLSDLSYIFAHFMTLTINLKNEAVNLLKATP